MFIQHQAQKHEMFARSLLTEEEHKPNAQEAHLMSVTFIGGMLQDTHMLRCQYRFFSFT